MAESNKSKGIRRNEREWRSLLARFGSSGLGVEAFCRREAISAASFYRWRGLLSEADAGAEKIGRDTALGFLDLGTLDSASAATRLDLKLELGGGLTLHLVRG